MTDVFLKGTVSRDFLFLVFFTKQLLLVPIEMPSGLFEFWRIFAEIFAILIDSPVSRTPGSRDSPVSWTPGSRDSKVS